MPFIGLWRSADKKSAPAKKNHLKFERHFASCLNFCSDYLLDEWNCSLFMHQGEYFRWNCLRFMLLCLE